MNLLPRKERPVVINTKGAPVGVGKSTLRPLQKKMGRRHRRAMVVEWSSR